MTFHPNFSSIRFLNKTYNDLPSNLALDEALLLDSENSSQVPWLRIWEPARLGVVLGASGRLQQDVDVERCRAEGVEIGRRSSGGGTVLIGPGTLNVTLVLPAGAKPEYRLVDSAQLAVLETLADATRALNPAVRVQGHGDLTIDGRKFAGSAQRRLRDWFMIHVTILNTAPIEPILRYTRQPAKQPDYRENRSHDDFLVRFDAPTDLLVVAIRETWQAGSVLEELPRPINDQVAEMVQSRFGTPEWIERL